MSGFWNNKMRNEPVMVRVHGNHGEPSDYDGTGGEVDLKNCLYEIRKSSLGYEVLMQDKYLVGDVDFVSEDAKKEWLIWFAGKVKNQVSHPFCFRLYETRNGYRFFVTNTPIRGGSLMSKVIMERYECDPLYVQICQHQNCYRARLEPKPNRIPYDHSKHQYGVCKLVGDFCKEGTEMVIEEDCQQIIDLHDGMVLNGDKPLA